MEPAPRTARNHGRPRRSENDVLRAFESDFRGVTDENIFRGIFGARLTDDDVGPYVARVAATRERPRGHAHADEIEFHECYDHAFSRKPKWIFVSGREGAGKTTFLRYYFDFFRWNVTHFSKASWEWRANEVLLYSDVRRNVKTGKTDKILSDWSEELLRRFRDIDSEGDYAMWDRLAHWGLRSHDDAQVSFPTRSAYRAHYTEQWRKEPDVLVRECLWYLAKTNRHVTLIVDNIDQHPLPEQRATLLFVLGLARSVSEEDADRTSEDSDSGLWRVVVPVRPETLRSLQSVVVPLPHHSLLELIPASLETIVKKRADRLREAVRQSMKDVERTLVAEESTPVYYPLPNSIAAKVLPRLLYAQPDSVDEGSATDSVRAAPVTEPLFDNVCGGSVRRTLRLRTRVSSSAALQWLLFDRTRGRTIDDWEAEPEKPVAVRNYLFLDGLLTGSYEYFYEDDPDCDLTNMFCVGGWGGGMAGAYGTLLGVHTLAVLKRCGRVTMERLCGLLLGVGYHETEVERAVERFEQKGMVKTHGERAHEKEIFVEKDVVEGHWALLTEPAYVDNMALVTPVEGKWLRGISTTVGYLPSHFVRRVQSTMSFLRQVREDEEHVRCWSVGRKRNGPAEDLIGALRSLELPWIWKRIAARYRRRLVSLKTLRTEKTALSVSSSQWKDLLENDVFGAKAGGDDDAVLEMTP